MQRILGLVMLPGFTSWVITEFIVACERAKKDLNIHEDDAESIRAKANELGPRADQYLLQAMNRHDVDQRLQMINFTKIFEQRVSDSRPDIHGAVEGLLKSVLVQTWTAVETLLQDLWESVLNEQPKYLAALSGKGPSEKKIDLHILEKNNFDTSSIMGTLLKSKFNFTVLDETRKAYALAFASDREKIDAVLCDPSVDVLSLLRNLIVHKDGKVDERFKKESSGLAALTKISATPEGETVQFDGFMVAAFVPPVVHAACNLIKAVDEWLTAHPTPVK